MAKPIVISRVPVFCKDHLIELKDGLTLELNNEYHVIVVTDDSLSIPQFEVYNVDKEPEIDYEGLIKLINDRA